MVRWDVSATPPFACRNSRSHTSDSVFVIAGAITSTNSFNVAQRSGDFRFALRAERASTGLLAASAALWAARSSAHVLPGGMSPLAFCWGVAGERLNWADTRHECLNRAIKNEVYILSLDAAGLPTRPVDVDGAIGLRMLINFGNV